MLERQTAFREEQVELQTSFGIMGFIARRRKDEGIIIATEKERAGRWGTYMMAGCGRIIAGACVSDGELAAGVSWNWSKVSGMLSQENRFGKDWVRLHAFFGIMEIIRTRGRMRLSS
jgi:hypothetical protein